MREVALFSNLNEEDFALIHSTLSDLGYWVDWVTLIGLAMAVGGAVAAYALPLITIRRELGHR